MQSNIEMNTAFLGHARNAVYYLLLSIILFIIILKQSIKYYLCDSNSSGVLS